MEPRGPQIAIPYNTSCPPKAPIARPSNTFGPPKAHITISYSTLSPRNAQLAIPYNMLGPTLQYLTARVALPEAFPGIHCCPRRLATASNFVAPGRARGREPGLSRAQGGNHAQYTMGLATRVLVFCIDVRSRGCSSPPRIPLGFTYVVAWSELLPKDGGT